MARTSEGARWGGPGEGGAGLDALAPAQVARLLDSVAQRIALIRAEGPGRFRMIGVNSQTARWWACDARSIVDLPLEECMSAPKLAALLPRYQHVADHGEAVHYSDTSASRRDRVLAASIVPLGDDDEGRPLLAWVARDTTLEALSEDMRRRQTMLLESVSDAVITTDAELRITGWNPAAEAIYGYPASAMVGRSATQLWVSASGAAHVDSGLEQVLSHGSWKGEVRHRRADGVSLCLLASVSALVDPDGEIRGFVAVNKDITDWKRATERLEHLALHDALTGLANRTQLLHALEVLVAEDAQVPVCVAFLDLNEMKLVNDSLGHEAGDAVLTAVAARLQAAVRPGDLVARLGGDEFVVVAPVDDVAAALAVAERASAAIASPLVVEGQELRPTAAVGLALGGPGDDAAQLLRDADSAMYEAKERRHEGVQLFDASMRGSAAQRLREVQALRAAVEREELRLHYQPIVRLDTLAPVGTEALLRWSPATGPVPPTTFIPLAERTGLIAPLGTWVLEHACRQLRRWNDDDGELIMSINVSVVQLTARSFADAVADALARHGVPADRLVLEITESVFLDDPTRARASLDTLVALGVRFAIDDFGTGFSSLSYLRDLPVSAVKIDRSFTHRLGSPRDDAVVRATLELVHVLGLRVVAEGVETEAQADVLRRFGCDFAQGFLFGRPAPPEELAALEAHRVGRTTAA